MRKWFKILSVLVLSSLLVACGDKDNRESVSRGKSRTSRDASGTTSSGRRGTINNGQQGVISATQEQLDAFVSVAGDPEDIVGYISVSGGGVFFKGSATTGASGADYNSVSITNANIEIIIKDDRSINDGEEPIYINKFRFNNGSVRNLGNSDEVSVEFYDETYKQWLILEGIAEHSTTGDFYGTMYFDNEVYGVDTNGKVALGQFSIPVCSFFNCK